MLIFLGGMVSGAIGGVFVMAAVAFTKDAD